MAKKKKGPRNVIGLKCSNCKRVNYITTKNRNNTEGKLKRRKHCPTTNRPENHVETSKLK